MSKINFLCLTAISLTFIACSGKVQTNPLPESKQFVLPKSQVVLTNQVSKHRVDDFDKFLADFFSKRKKVVIVDNIYNLTETGKHLYDVSISMAWLGSIAYTLQIYMDFSGYAREMCILDCIFSSTIQSSNAPASCRRPCDVNPQMKKDAALEKSNLSLTHALLLYII